MNAYCELFLYSKTSSHFSLAKFSSNYLFFTGTYNDKEEQIICVECPMKTYALVFRILALLPLVWNSEAWYKQETDEHTKHTKTTI